MGSVCCCLSFDDFEDYVNPNSPVYRNCVCLSCLIQNLLSVVCSCFPFPCLFPLLFPFLFLAHGRVMLCLVLCVVVQNLNFVALPMTQCIVFALNNILVRWPTCCVWSEIRLVFVSIGLLLHFPLSWIYKHEQLSVGDAGISLSLVFQCLIPLVLKCVW